MHHSETVFSWHTAFLVKDLQRQEKRLQDGMCAAFLPSVCLATNGGSEARCSTSTTSGTVSCCGRPLLTSGQVEEIRTITARTTTETSEERVEAKILEMKGTGTATSTDRTNNEGFFEESAGGQVPAPDIAPPQDHERSDGQDEMKTAKINDTVAVAPVSTVLFASYDDSNFRPFIRRCYAPLLTLPVVKLLVCVVFFGYCGFSIYCITNVTKDFDLKELCPDESYYRDMLEITDQMYEMSGKGRLNFGLYYTHDHSQLDSQNVMIEHETTVRHLKYVESDEVTSWFRAFRQYCVTNGTVCAQEKVPGIS